MKIEFFFHKKKNRITLQLVKVFCLYFNEIFTVTYHVLGKSNACSGNVFIACTKQIQLKLAKTKKIGVSEQLNEKKLNHIHNNNKNDEKLCIIYHLP